MPRAPAQMWVLPLSRPSPPLALPTRGILHSLTSAASLRLTVPRDKETGEALQLDRKPPGQGGQGLGLDPRKPQPGTADWFSSLPGGAGSPAPLTPTPPPPPRACSPQHILHPAPCPWLHRFTQRQRERAFSLRSKCFFLPFSLPWKLLFLHLACQLWSWGKGETPRQGGRSLIPS